MEHFIFNHFWGYTRVEMDQTLEYRINHPSWEINKVIEHQIDCDFGVFYGQNFEVLNHVKPTLVYLAIGSDISVDWKRNRI